MSKIIGIVGGVGPYTGLNINRSVFDNTLTSGTDQEHLEVYLLSRSSDINDRTDFLSGKGEENPADGIFRTIEKLSQIGAEVIGIPCNTAHAPEIFDSIKEQIKAAALDVKLLHLIEETADHIKKKYGNIQKIGLLGTLGTLNTGIYQEVLENMGNYTVIIPQTQEEREQVQMAISHREYGIKAVASPVRTQAVDILKNASEQLFKCGAELIIMGCTEIPLGLNSSVFDKIPLIDPSEILSRALIREAAPSQLKP